MTQTNSKNSRIEYIDFLKAIGLIAIMTAHVGSPNKVMMLRNFDVPMMVIISSLLAGISYEKHKGEPVSVLKYYLNRIKRLVLPTWVFLVIFFVILYLKNHQFNSLDFYLYSFGLTMYGIGYVWVILAYLYSSLWIPILKKLPLGWFSIVLVAVIYFIYEYMYKKRIGLDSRFLVSTFYFIIPYGLLTFLGINYRKYKTWHKVTIMLISLAVFIGFGAYYWKITGTIQSTQMCKYPPRLYYLGYGIFATFFALLFCEKIPLKLYSLKPIKFISSHSLWIYLWHILVIDLYDSIGLPEIWYIKLCVVFTVTVLFTYIVNALIDLLEKKKSIPILKIFRG